MNNEQWVAVRCCCTPKKIFGFMRFSTDKILHGSHQQVVDNQGNIHLVEFRSISINNKTYYDVDDNCIDTDIIRIISDHRTKEIAIYSGDRPIEFWRTLNGFLEVQQFEMTGGQQ